MSTDAPDILDLIAERLEQIGITLPPDATPETVYEIVYTQTALVRLSDHMNNLNQLGLIKAALDNMQAPKPAPGTNFPIVVQLVEYLQQKNDELVVVLRRLDALQVRAEEMQKRIGQ